MAYIGPQTKGEDVEEFIVNTLKENGDRHLLCGDLNARHIAWDTVSNERGTTIHEVANRIPRTYICAAKLNSY